MSSKLRRWALPLVVFAASSAVYVALLRDRLGRPAADNHYVHLANSWLHGQLDVVGGRPPGQNDWACYDTVSRGACPPNRFSFPGQEARYRWYVSFPPLPALVILPFVAIAGTGVHDALFWAILAGLAPALLFVLLRALRECGRSDRTQREDLLLTALFAFGTVYFFTAVQGSVWFAAHVVAVPLVVLFILWSLDARRPWLAGIALGAAFLARPTTLYLAPLFLLEAAHQAQAEDRGTAGARSSWAWLRAVRWKRWLRRVAPFAVGVAAAGVVAAAHNYARFGNPQEFGHTYLQIYWRDRIERWGLFNYHYLGRNLAVFVASLPWLSASPPYFMVSRHGLAFWVTTPGLLAVFWPKKTSFTALALALSAAIVALVNLCYQNSGWIQFGYRFALDYIPLLFVLLAIGGRRFGRGFWTLAALSVAINAFGAVTFDRAGSYYDDDATQSRLFQPD